VSAGFRFQTPGINGYEIRLSIQEKAPAQIGSLAIIIHAPEVNCGRAFWYVAKRVPCAPSIIPRDKRKQIVTSEHQVYLRKEGR